MRQSPTVDGCRSGRFERELILLLAWGRPYYAGVIHLRMNVAGLGRTRFAYSPLIEVAESLYMLSSGQVHPLHRTWFDTIRDGLRGVDLGLLRAVVPARGYVADFFTAGLNGPSTTIERQLSVLSELPAGRIRAEIETVWQGEPLPPAARDLFESGAAAPCRLAAALGLYWSVAIEPYWQAMRAVLDDDVASRAGELSKGGVGGLLTDLHPQISMRGEVLTIEKRHAWQQDLTGEGLLLVPSVFVWPNLIFAAGPDGPARLIYPARGVGNVWQAPIQEPAEDDALGALLGRSRAAILLTLALPHSTTELARKLEQSPPSVSQHLAVLRRSGLVVSWRSGRRVLYRRTALATSVVEASSLETKRAAGEALPGRWPR
jgi:DNA-binding transcriptional ArsR family regulator